MYLYTIKATLYNINWLLEAKNTFTVFPRTLARKTENTDIHLKNKNHFVLVFLWYFNW